MSQQKEKTYMELKYEIFIQKQIEDKFKDNNQSAKELLDSIKKLNIQQLDLNSLDIFINNHIKKSKEKAKKSSIESKQNNITTLESNKKSSIDLNFKDTDNHNSSTQNRKPIRQNLSLIQYKTYGKQNEFKKIELLTRKTNEENSQKQTKINDDFKEIKSQISAGIKRKEIQAFRNIENYAYQNQVNKEIDVQSNRYNRSLKSNDFYTQLLNSSQSANLTHSKFSQQNPESEKKSSELQTPSQIKNQIQSNEFNYYSNLNMITKPSYNKDKMLLNLKNNRNSVNQSFKKLENCKDGQNYFPNIKIKVPTESSEKSSMHDNNYEFILPQYTSEHATISTEEQNPNQEIKQENKIQILENQQSMLNKIEILQTQSMFSTQRAQQSEKPKLFIQNIDTLFNKKRQVKNKSQLQDIQEYRKRSTEKIVHGRVLQTYRQAPQIKLNNNQDFAFTIKFQDDQKQQFNNQSAQKQVNQYIDIVIQSDKQSKNRIVSKFEIYKNIIKIKNDFEQIQLVTDEKEKRKRENINRSALIEKSRLQNDKSTGIMKYDMEQNVYQDLFNSEDASIQDQKSQQYINKAFLLNNQIKNSNFQSKSSQNIDTSEINILVDNKQNNIILPSLINKDTKSQLINIQTNKQEFLNSGLMQFINELKDQSNRKTNKFSKSVLDKNPMNQTQITQSVQPEPISFKQNFKIVPIKNYDIFTQEKSNLPQSKTSGKILIGRKQSIPSENKKQFKLNVKIQEQKNSYSQSILPTIKNTNEQLKEKDSEQENDQQNLNSNEYKIMIFDDEIINKQEFEFERQAIYKNTKVNKYKESQSLTNDRLFSEVSNSSTRNQKRKLKIHQSVRASLKLKNSQKYISSRVNNQSKQNELETIKAIQNDISVDGKSFKQNVQPQIIILNSTINHNLESNTSQNIDDIEDILKQKQELQNLIVNDYSLQESLISTQKYNPALFNIDDTARINHNWQHSFSQQLVLNKINLQIDGSNVAGKNFKKNIELNQNSTLLNKKDSTKILIGKKKEHFVLELNDLNVKGQKIDKQIQPSNAYKQNLLNPYNDDFLNQNNKYFSQIIINKQKGKSSQDMVNNTDTTNKQ